MFECKIENEKGSILTLTQNETNYQVIDIKGLNPPNAQINMSSIAGLDGAKFNSSKLETRNIVIYIKLNNDIEANRIMLYSYFATKEWCKFYYKNEHRNVHIDCYVQTVEVTPFTRDEIMQVSLLCPNPYFKDMEQIIDDISKALATFEFPFAINIGDPIPFSIIDTSRIASVYNNSESETGVIIELEILGEVNTIQIRNTVTGETFTLDYSFLINDKVTINTNKGEKSVILTREAVNSNLFTAVRKGSTFFQLSTGDNFFGYIVDDGDSDDSVHILFKHYTIYRGV